MHLVTAPERSDAYIVSTAPYGETGPTSYTPGQYMDIHVITVGPQYMKFLGILMYQNTHFFTGIDIRLS